jgi:autotransporter-associated beta strand protein
MKKTTNIMKKALYFIVVAFITTTASDTIAGNTWDGGGSSGSWSNSTNWDLDTLPSTGNPLSFVGNIQNNTTNNLAAVDPSFTGIIFQNNGTVNNTNAFTLAGNRIILGGNIGTAANTTGTTITDIISLDIILNTNSTINTRQLSPSVQHNLTISGIISETGGARTLTKSEGGTLILSGANTYTGATTVTAGTLTLSGNRMVNTTGAYSVSGAGTQTLNIQNGNYTIGVNFIVGSSTGIATVNHSAGTISVAGGGLIMGNGPGSSTSFYNLSGGSLTTANIIMGSNSGMSAVAPHTSTINVSGNGALTVGNLRIGRYDFAGVTNTTSTFTQTAGTTTVTTLGLGGNSANATNSTGKIIANLNLTGGIFTATNIASLSAGGAASSSNANSSSINIGGTAKVTLGTFGSIVKGQNSTATITFDSGATGFLAPVTNSTTYMPNGTFTRAFLTANGANFNVGSGKDITIGQVLENASGASGTLTKSGVGLLTLLGNNTYSGSTIISAGTLLISGTGSINNTSEILVSTGATLQYNSTTALTKSLTIGSGATLGGSGTVQDLTLNGGIVAPGNSLGLLTANALNGSNGTFQFQLGAPNFRGVTYDAINVNSLLTLGTDTDFTFETLNNYTFADGDTYDLFNWGSADMTNFNVSALEAALPSLASTPNLSWNVSQFTLDGSVSVIPEPTVLELIIMPLQALKALCRIQAEFAIQNPIIATIQNSIIVTIRTGI